MIVAEDILWKIRPARITFIAKTGDIIGRSGRFLFEHNFLGRKDHFLWPDKSAPWRHPRSNFPDQKRRLRHLRGNREYRHPRPSGENSGNNFQYARFQLPPVPDFDCPDLPDRTGRRSRSPVQRDTDYPARSSDRWRHSGRLSTS